jgi:hypothetical protein
MFRTGGHTRAFDRESVIKRPIVLLCLGLGLSISAQAASAQQPSDPRIADFVKAGKLRAAFGMNSTIATKDPASGQLGGPRSRKSWRSA